MVSIPALASESSGPDLCPAANDAQWRDGPGMNSFLMKMIFPATRVETAQDWKDHLKVGRPVVFDKVVLYDRSVSSASSPSPTPHSADVLLVCKAGHHSPTCANLYYKSVSDLLVGLPLPFDWFRPLRAALFSNFAPAEPKPRPVITYISRQKARTRALADKDHTELVLRLVALVKERDWELRIPEMEKMSLEEQVLLASRSEILIGIHGSRSPPHSFASARLRLLIFPLLVQTVSRTRCGCPHRLRPQCLSPPAVSRMLPGADPCLLLQHRALSTGRLQLRLLAAVRHARVSPAPLPPLPALLAVADGRYVPSHGHYVVWGDGSSFNTAT